MAAATSAPVTDRALAVAGSNSGGGGGYGGGEGYNGGAAGAAYGSATLPAEIGFRGRRRVQLRRSQRRRCDPPDSDTDSAGRRHTLCQRREWHRRRRRLGRLAIRHGPVLRGQDHLLRTAAAAGGGGRIAVYYADGSGYIAFPNCTASGSAPGENGTVGDSSIRLARTRNSSCSGALNTRRTAT